jgi:hypothetical protein
MPDPTRLVDSWERAVVLPLWAAAGIRAGLRWAAEHTGLPVIVVAGFALVTSWRVFKHTLRFLIEVALASALLFLATRFGLLRW